MNQTIELPVGIAMDIRNILAVLVDNPALAEKVEGELDVEPGLIDDTLAVLRPLVDGALGNNS